ncbi:MAG: EamA family transporter [Candidatus Dormiibacterota bacterium]
MTVARTEPVRESRRQGRPVLPPHVWFLISALFHYLGPALAVLLFARVAPLGVAWMRVGSASVFFAAWRRPWRAVLRRLARWRLLVVAFGLVLGVMNSCFYLAIARVPLGTVGAIEFLGPIALALWGARTKRNLGALVLAVGGAALLADVQLRGELLGFAFAAANCALFAVYIVLAHRLARDDGGGGLDALALAMPIGLLTVTPFGLGDAWPALVQPTLLLAGIGVGLCSSVMPYVTDQLAMARLPRATYALFLALLPATATAIGVVVLHQWPTLPELAGVVLVVGGVALHRS